MPTILRACALFVLMAALPAAGGCAYRLGGRTVSDPAWNASHGSAGKVLLVVSGSPEDGMASDHFAEVTSIATNALAQLPGTTVLESAPPATTSAPATAPATAPAQWPADISDAQAIAAARDRGADSVCLLTIGQYSGVFAIDLIPPEWYGSTHILYTLRLINVHTGALLAHAVTYYSTGGTFQVRTHDDLKRDLAHTLKLDLTPAPPRP